MKQEYKMAFSEVDEIIKMMPDELVRKIPKGFKELVAEEKDESYIPNIHEPLEKNKLKNETIIILGLIYRDFLCPKEERIILQKKDAEELQRVQNELNKELREKYSMDNLFNKNVTENVKEEDTNNTNEVAMVEFKEEKWYRKIYNIIKGIFGKKNKVTRKEINNYIYYKKNNNDLIWWVRNQGQKGELLFSFDKKKIFNAWIDYPYNLTKEQKEIFDRENPYWRDFFMNRIQ